jgi:diguanylate cyclase (GGDEF)-like protein
MSMYKQLWLAIICSILLTLTGCLLASMLSARDYLAEQLSMKNADNATVLALSLSQQQPDTVIVELAVAALYDSGYYASIQVIDPFGRVIISRGNGLQNHTTPTWFRKLLPISALPGEAMIMDGWAQFGTVVLSSNSDFAHASLWRSSLRMGLAALFAGLLGLILGSRILARLHPPLLAVINQAKGISERRFLVMDEPKVPELKQLTTAMNTMVVRLKDILDEEAGKLEQVRLEANCDALTGLANRRHFLSHLTSVLESEELAGGALVMIRIDDLNGINRRLGRTLTDELLLAVAARLKDYVKELPQALVGRLNGADFALLLDADLALDARAKDLYSIVQNELAAHTGNNSSISIGAASFDKGMELPAILSMADIALAAAELSSGNRINTGAALPNRVPRSSDDWARLINAAIVFNRVRLVSYPVKGLDGVLLHHECPLRLKLEESAEWLTAGAFLPMAERLKLTAVLDLAAIRLGLQELEHDPDLPALAVNLSGSSIEDVNFLANLASLLKQHASVAPRLWTETSESSALHNIDAFRLLVQTVKAAGCRIGIEHVGPRFCEIGRFHHLGLDFLKVDGSFIHGIATNTGNQNFLKGLTYIARGMGLLVIAEGVNSLDDINTLRELGFDGATGPAIS